MIIKEFFGLKDVYEIELEPIRDNRGEFKRIYDDNIFKKYGLNTKWIQENHSISLKKNTVRGLHFQTGQYSETKLVKCIKGEILDVFVDLRKDSKTFGKYGSIVLTENNNKMIYIPVGFAHGFRTLVDNCEILYKVNNYYSPQNESGIKWNDPDVNIDWCFSDDCDNGNVVLSDRDSKLMSFREVVKL